MTYRLDVECPACGADNIPEEALLGTLGSLDHYRCRFCGMGWSQPAQGEDGEEED